jgi:hypothetical protein
MQGFLSFLIEAEQESQTHELEHPLKGKYTLHKKGDYHYAKNKYGEISHTFYKMEPEHIVGRLSHEHDIHQKSQKTKVQESILNEMSASSVNIHRGAFNEAMFAYHANGRKWIDDNHKTAAFRHKQMLDKYDKLEARRQNDRAMAQVQSFTEHAKKNGYSKIKAVHITAKPGDIERHTGIKATQQENPSDVVVHFHNKPKEAEHGFLGASLKSSASKKIGFHNGGLGSISKSLGGVDLSSEAKKQQTSFIKKKGLPTVLSQAAAKLAGKNKESKSYRNNPAYREASEHMNKIDNKVRDKLHQHYSSMKSNDLKEHLLKTYIKASTSHALPYVKTHGTGGYDKTASAHTEDPSDNEMYHSLRDAKKVHVEKAGNSNMSVHADGKRMFGIQIKHNNGPLTALKVIAQP